jgi:hypothetical protein
VEVVEPDQKAFEDHLQARTEKDVEVFDQGKMYCPLFIYFLSLQEIWKCIWNNMKYTFHLFILSIKVTLNIDKAQE